MTCVALMSASSLIDEIDSEGNFSEAVIVDILFRNIVCVFFIFRFSRLLLVGGSDSALL